MNRMRITLPHFLVSMLAMLGCTICTAAEQKQIEDLELEALLKQRVSLYRESDTASGVRESIIDAPAAMLVITKDDIARRGYLNLDEVLSDLPGFDTITTNGSFPVIFYQRGYRTPFTQRTLIMINGKVDNNLWNHTAVIAKQYPMQAIERVEVLYGPAGAVYGPNAFSGVINIITRDPRSLKEQEQYFRTQVSAGAFASYAVDFTAGGSLAGMNYVVSGRGYQSDGPAVDDYSDWGYVNEALLSDPAIWGSAIANSDFNHDGIQDSFAGYTLGHYGDKSTDSGIFAEISKGNLKLGINHWRVNEGYGPYYAFDKGQPNSSWNHDETQYYLEHHGQVNDVDISSELLYRENGVFGFWAENFDGWVSLSNWNSFNRAWRVRQQYNYQLTPELQLSGGVKFEHKDLTKAYVLCGYWAGSVCPADGGFSDGSAVREPGNRDTIELPAHLDRDQLVPESRISTIDKGLFLQAIYSIGKWRFNGGLRWDNNSEYGSVTIPRGAVIYHYSSDTTFKLVYGEAFQEPSPKDLYGGWSGRQANADLQPETMKNLEFIVIHQTENFMHDLSVYYARYQHVIVNGSSGNIGGRQAFGVEYRGQMNFNNPFFSAEDITGKLYYTYTNVQADYQYIQGYNEDGSGSWVKKSDDLGDIAPHKVSLILDLPLSEHWGLNLQSNWVSARELYSENPLRAEYNNYRLASDNRKAGAYITVDMNLRYHQPSYTLGLKVENLLGEHYWQPGAESASSGDDFSKPSAGFNNSLLPQLKEPVLTGYFTLRF